MTQVNERQAVLSANQLSIFISAYKPAVSILLLTFSIFEVGSMLDFCPF